MEPNESLFPEEWAWKALHPDREGRPLPPDLQPGELAKVVVAIVDSGVARGHVDLTEYVTMHGTVLGDTGDDDDDHGTLVAGIVLRAGSGLFNPQNLEIRSMKFCSQQVWPTANLAAEAINKCLDGAPVPDVIVLAWDVGYTTQALRDAIERAGEKDVVVVAAAGNEGLNIDLYGNWPASYAAEMNHVITVMASDKEHDRASFSSYGATSVQIAAPGSEIVSTVPYFGGAAGGASVPIGYRTFRGSSAAAAIVAGIAALMRAQNPDLSAHEIRELVGSAVQRKGKLEGRCESGGIPDFQKALSAARAAVAQSPEPSAKPEFEARRAKP